MITAIKVLLNEIELQCWTYRYIPWWQSKKDCTSLWLFSNRKPKKKKKKFTKGIFEEVISIIWLNDVIHFLPVLQGERRLSLLDTVSLCDTQENETKPELPLFPVIILQKTKHTYPNTRDSPSSRSFHFKLISMAVQKKWEVTKLMTEIQAEVQFYWATHLGYW